MATMMLVQPGGPGSAVAVPMGLRAVTEAWRCSTASPFAWRYIATPWPWPLWPCVSVLASEKWSGGLSVQSLLGPKAWGLPVYLWSLPRRERTRTRAGRHQGHRYPCVVPFLPLRGFPPLLCQPQALYLTIPWHIGEPAALPGPQHPGGCCWPQWAFLGTQRAAFITSAPVVLSSLLSEFYQLFLHILHSLVTNLIEFIFRVCFSSWNGKVIQ